MKEQPKAQAFERTRTLLLPVLLGVGALCLALSFFLGQKQKPTLPKDDPLARYISTTEARLCETIEQIEGAGKAKVFITAENTFETVYASNASIVESADGSGASARTSKTSEKSLAYAASRTTGGEPVVVKQLCPRLSGVLIVCEGGDRENVRDEICAAVSTALGLSKNKIYVTGGTGTP